MKPLKKSDQKYIRTGLEKQQCITALKCIRENPLLSDIKVEDIDDRIASITISDRETAALARWREHKKYKSFEDVPIDIFDEMLKNNPFADSFKVTLKRLIEMGIPVYAGTQRKGKTFNLNKMLDWIFAVILSKKKSSNSRDPIIAAIDETYNEVSDDEIEETTELKKEYIKCQIAEKRIKIAKEEGSLVPADVFRAILSDAASNLHQFGELLKRNGRHEELNEFNKRIEVLFNTFEPE